MSFVNLLVALLFGLVYILVVVIMGLWLTGRKYAKEDRDRQVSHD